ncbi:hypothetical protein [Capnocytophaga granulosa]
MQDFIIQSNPYLKNNILGYYHTDYSNYGKPNNPDFLVELKNTFNNKDPFILNQATNQLMLILKNDIFQIINIIRQHIQDIINFNSLTPLFIRSQILLAYQRMDQQEVMRLQEHYKALTGTYYNPQIPPMPQMPNVYNTQSFRFITYLMNGYYMINNKVLDYMNSYWGDFPPQGFSYNNDDILEQARKIDKFTICVVPRSKAESNYHPNQLLFKRTISNFAQSNNHILIDGTSFIIRHTNTRTTHIRKYLEGFNNDGELPRPGLAKETCHFSNELWGKDVILIDDIYTKTVNIDEDVIQSLLDNGVRSIVFYAIGKTVLK